MDARQPDEAELRREAQEEVDRRWPFRLEAEAGLDFLSLRHFLLSEGALAPNEQAAEPASEQEATLPLYQADGETGVAETRK